MKIIIIIALFLLTLILFADLEDCEITVSSGNVNAGESVMITVSTSELLEEWDVISFQFEMFYNPAVVTFDDYAEGDIFTEGMLIMNELEPGTLRAAYSYYLAQPGAGIILRMYFVGISGETGLDIHDFKFNATIIENAIDGNIIVNGENLLPIADAGIDITVNEGVLVELDGSNSYDPEGNTVTYLWTAPDEIVLEDPTSAIISFTAPMVTEETEFIISLVVNDGIHNSLPDEVIVTVQNVDAIDEFPAQITQVGIHSISPNPFNPSTTISFLVPYNETDLELKIYSIKGQLVKSYHLTGLPSNSLSQVTWQGCDNSGNSVASGIYFCQISGNNSKDYSRMLLLK